MKLQVMLVLFLCVILYYVTISQFCLFIYLIDIWVISSLGCPEECSCEYSYTCLSIYRISVAYVLDMSPFLVLKVPDIFFLMDSCLFTQGEVNLIRNLERPCELRRVEQSPEECLGLKEAKMGVLGVPMPM